MKQHRMTAQSRRNLAQAEIAFVERFSALPTPGKAQIPRYGIRWEDEARVGYAFAGDGSIMLYRSPLAAERALARARGDHSPTG